MAKRATEILYIGNKLQAHGLTPTSIETLGVMLTGEGYKMQYSSSKKNKIARLLDMCLSIIRSKSTVDYVIIDTYSTSAFYFAYVCARLCSMLGIPYVPILRGGDLPNRIKSSHGLCKTLFDNSYANVVVSDYIGKSMDEAGFKYKLIPNNIELSNYPYKQRTKATAELLWVRSFSTIYNPTLAIEVVKELSKTYPDVKLTMVGPDKDGSLQVCKDLAVELGVADKVTFTGRLSKEDWIKLSAEHSIFFSTTDFDNLPVSVIEAMSLGMPVVSTNVGGVPYLINDGVDGLLVPPKDKQAMIDALTALLNDDALTARISSAARKKGEQYDWQVIKETWNNLFSRSKEESVHAL